MFENVNYNFYKNNLGRSAVPDEAAFNEYAAENKLFVKRLINDGVIFELEKDGIDSAVCMMIETDYTTAQEANASEGGAVASESINGYSYSYDRTAAQEEAKLNAKSTEAKKLKWLRLYCDIVQGVR
ncbi:hypothetical protein E4O06_08190 [Treponema sp. OMZ 789]|nr:hypothetical protein E4O06_08190 [Treponema sp. OMZ 789]UTC71207.1 hypothetical protein E4O01_08330 [Treponema sp. OMZ 790]UTC73924.1 hypothetical protein E4O02_08520 [Treponema sp. OMZ 791]